MAALALSPLAASGATPYHLELEANPAAAFPFLGRFGALTLHVYPGGVRAESFWLSGFSRSGTQQVTVLDPMARSYSEVAMTDLAPMLAKLGSHDPIPGYVPPILPPAGGKVLGLDARRYRLVYGSEAWIDVWTSTALPENAQYRALAIEFVRGIAPATATALRTIPGTPIYVELNFRRFKKVALLRLKSFTPNADGEAKALTVGALYFKTPSIDWK